MFILSAVGFTHLVVDSAFLEWFRNFVKKASLKVSEWVKIPKVAKFGNVVDCYVCAGVWCGFVMGAIWLSWNPFKIIACGCASGLLSNFAAIFINYLEAKTVVVLNENNPEQK